ncbi:MAG: ribokinase [Anaerolineae bacterium]|nr:ribokinase [Anaerolineae bacterium]
MHPLSQWIPRLAQQSVLVIGDIILDEYLIGRVTRMSREAPVPVLEFETRQIIPGGAANPAANIAALGSHAMQVGVIGSDSAGTTLRQVLQARGIDTGGLVTDPARPTTVKMRIMAQMGLRFPQQVARMDTLSREPVAASIEQQLRERIETQISRVSAVLLSDYHGGLLTESLVKVIRELTNGSLITVDAQGGLEKYREFDVVKCNADEAREHLRRDLRTDADFAEAARELCDHLALTGAMVITRGPDGATVAACNGEITHCPSPSVTDVYDVVGAGDTSIAVLTLAVAAGAPYGEAVTLANYASGLVVRRVGNYTPSPAELEWALSNWQ